MRKIIAIIPLLLFFAFVTGCQEGMEKKEASGELDRTVLPIKEPTPPTYNQLDVKGATATTTI